MRRGPSSDNGQEKRSGPFVVQVFDSSAQAVLLVFLAMAVFIFGLHQLLAVLHRYPLDYGEAPLVDQAMRLAAGGSMQSPRNIYRADLSTPPYTISNYPPLFVLALAPFIAIFGPNFWAGRLISILGALAVGLFLARIVQVEDRDRFTGTVAAGLFLTMPYVVHWSSLLRIDLLALALSTAALYVFVRRPEARGTLVGGGLLLVAAIYTRQSYALAAPLAAFVWLWRSVGWRRALTLATMVAGVSLVLFLILYALTGGGFFFNIVTANVNEFSWDRVRWNLENLSRDAPFLLLLGAVSLGAMPALGVPHWPLVVPYLVGAFLSCLTIGKIGSNVNYFLELCAALSLTAGTWIAWTGTVAEKRWRRWVRVGLLLLLTLQVGWLIRSTLGEYVPRLRERRAATALLEDLEWEIAHTGDHGRGHVIGDEYGDRSAVVPTAAKDHGRGHVIGDEYGDRSAVVPTAAKDHGRGRVIGDEYVGLVTLQGWPLYIQPFEMTQLAQAGLWDQTPFVEEIRDGAFDMILIHYFPDYDVYKERWTPEMLAAIKRAYKPERMYADTRLYLPRAGSSAPTKACPEGTWQLPSEGQLGVHWDGAFLDLQGRGNAGEVPVYAVADGLLTRRTGWHGAVAIRHEDPLEHGATVWSLYGDMMSADGEDSFVVSDFPPGAMEVPVEAGQLLGYQGSWSGRADWPTWIHVRFAIVRGSSFAPAEDSAFPVERGSRRSAYGRKRSDIAQASSPYDFLRPDAYLGIALDEAASRTQPLQCQ